MPRRIVASVRFWDMAASEADGACFSAGVRETLWQDPLNREDWQVVVDDLVHGRWSPHRLEQTIKNTASQDGKRVSVYIEQEPGSSGIAVISRYVRLLRGYAVRGDRPTGDKVKRAENIAAAAEAGLVVLAPGPWNAVFLDEMQAFPSGPYADIVDAAAGAFNVLTLGNWSSLHDGPLLCSGESLDEDLPDEHEPFSKEELDQLPAGLREAVEGFGADDDDWY